MLTDDQIAILHDIDNSVAFDDDLQGKLTELIVSGFVQKDGDLYQLTPSGEKALLDRGAGLVTK